MATARHRDVGYARLSHADPDEQGAIARQKQDIRRVSESTGGELVGPILVDNAVSASRYARRKRKDYPKLLEMARAGAVDRAVIYDSDRLLRIPRELEDLIDVVEALGGRFQIVGCGPNSTMDLSSAEGQFVARILVAKNAKESDDTSRRLRRQMEQHAKEGRPWGANGGSRPLGWLDGETQDPVEVALLRAAAADVLDHGVDANEVARRWNLAGVRSRFGGPWSNRTVQAVLLSPRNAGLRQHNGQLYPATWPAIFDAGTHARLTRLFAERSRLPGRRTPFTGLFRTVDGRMMRRDTISRRQQVYRSARPAPGVEGPPTVTISPATDLEELTLEVLFCEVESGVVARRAAAQRRARPRVVGEDPAEVERLLRQAAADEAEGLITRGEWLAKRAPLERRLHRAESAQAAADTAEALEVIDPDVRRLWGAYPEERQRRVLFAVFDRVEIRPATRRGPGFDPGRVRPVFRG